MKLYKYRGNFDRDINFLADNKIFASTYDNLNDPFEGMFIDKEDREIIEIFKPFSNDVEKAYEDVLKTLDSLGIYSLSKDYDNEILWALYADSHHGFVIEYELEDLLKDFNFNNTIPLVHTVDVVYSANPPTTNTIFTSLKNEFNLTNLLGTKSIPWEKENEFRLIFEMNGIIEFNRKAVTSIIFGLRTSEQNINKAMNLLKGRQLKYYKIISESKTYKLKKVEIEDQYKDFVDLNDIVQKWEKDIPEKLAYYKPKIVEIINNILNLPNIKDIYSMDIDDDTDIIILRIFAVTSYEKIPIRFFEYTIGNWK